MHGRGKQLKMGRIAAAALTSALLLAGSALTAAAAANPTPSLSWSGYASSHDWSVAGNWSTSAPVAGSNYGTLTLGALGSACNGGDTKISCYTSENNLAGISVDELDIDDAAGYYLQGQGITVGAGGVQALAPKATPDNGSPYLDLPITLGADQTWNVSSITGAGGLALSTLTGPYSLSVNLNKSYLAFNAATSTGALNLSGTGGYAYAIADLNATSGPVMVSGGTALQIGEPGLQSGPLSTGSGAILWVGQGQAPDSTLQVNGALTLDTTSTLRLYLDSPGSAKGASTDPQPSTDYSQLTAPAGAVALGSVNLRLYQGDAKSGYCTDLHAGDVYTLVSGQSLAGTFAGLANGADVTIDPVCNFGGSNKSASATAQINYTATAVTATILSGGHAGDTPKIKTAPKLSGEAVVGHTLSVKSSWTASPTKLTYRWTLCPQGEGICENLTDHSSRLHLTARMAHRTVFAFVSASNRYGTAGAYSKSLTVRPAPKKR